MPSSPQRLMGLGLALLGLVFLAAAGRFMSWPVVAPVATEASPAATVQVRVPEAEPDAPEDDQPTAWVRGTVVDAEGHPMVGAVAKLDTVHGSFAGQTTRGGAFALNAPLGRHLLYATRLVGDDELVGPPLLFELRQGGVAGFELTLPMEGTVGVGMVLDLRGNDIVVTWAEEGRAAHDAGVRAGDRVLAIEGEPTDRMGVRDAERLLQGLMGTQVALTVGTAEEERLVLVDRRPASMDREEPQQ